MDESERTETDIPDDQPVSGPGLFPIVAVTGALLISGICASAWLRAQKPAAAAAPAIEAVPTANATPGSLAPNANPAVVTATTFDDPRNAPSQKGAVTLVAANQPNGSESSPRPRNANQKSVLGKKDAVDQLGLTRQTRLIVVGHECHSCRRLTAASRSIDLHTKL